MPTPFAPLEASLHELLEVLRLASRPPAASRASPQVCPVCLLTARSVERDIRALFAEFVNDPESRTRLRRSRGFCSIHTLLLAELGDALAVAILYSDLTERTRERWQSEVKGKFPFVKRQELIAPCPACAAANETENRYTQALAAGLAREEVWRAVENGPGLCTAHAEATMSAAKPADAARLRELETRHLVLLQAELEEIIRKNDYRFRGEEWGAERDAWLRALHKLRRP